MSSAVFQRRVAEIYVWLVTAIMHKYFCDGHRGKDARFRYHSAESHITVSMDLI